MNNKAYKTFFYLVALSIFFFLIKMFFDNWQKIKGYDFSFNYLYLVISYLFMIMAVFWGVKVWDKMLKILDPGIKLSYSETFKICIYSCLGRYLPGKVWMFAGRIHFAQQRGVPGKPLAMSIVYEIILSLVSGFILALILLSIAFGSKLYALYSAPILLIAVGLIFSHPKVLYFLFDLASKRFKKIEIEAKDFMSYWRVMQIILYYFFVYILQGIGLFFLINSFVSLSFYAIIGVIGAYALAVVFGAAVLFAPDGLGAREGVLALILSLYFPSSIAILISVVSRLWFSSTELIIWATLYFYSKLSVKNNKNDG